MYKYIFPATLLVFLFACGHQQQTTASKPGPRNPHMQATDKPVIDPNLNAESRSDYNPSFTRVSDLLHTKLDVSFDWNKRYMYGKATITARPYFYPSSTLELDARGMDIKRVAMVNRGISDAGMVTDDTTALKYTYDQKKLKIDLGRVFSKEQEYTVFIDYISKPDELKDLGGSAAISEDKGLYFINPDGSNPNSPKQIWTQGETQSNCVWMPTIDRPNERMTDEIYMRVEDKYKTLSNGVLAESKENGDGTRTDHWRMDLPHAPYLVMMAVGDFAIVKDKWHDKEVSYYVEPQFEPYARQTFGKTPDMIDFFSKKLGVDYVWPKYSQVCARDYVSGAMENTSATLHGDFVQRDDREYLDRTYEDYISHELFHQWFGDLVTCESWSNLPLNESFATYGEYLWDEHEYGKETADYGHYNSLQGYLDEANAGHATPDDPGKREPLIRYYYTDREDMFDGHSYNKGGQVLHLLRQYVGDDAFFASLHLYLETNKFKAAEADNLRLAFEETTGQDLHWFFNEWFYSPGHPELDISYNYDAANQKERVIIKQTQDRSNGTPVFRIPLSVDVYNGDKVTREECIVKSTCDTFWFASPAKPDFVNVDAQKTLPCFKIDHHTAQEWAFLYNHSKLYVDRVEAIDNLAPEGLGGEVTMMMNNKPVTSRHGAMAGPDSAIAVQTVTKALDDEFWAIRQMACEELGDYADHVKDKLTALAKKDEKSMVRAAAISALNAGSKSDDLKSVYLDALNDRSYTVITRALVALADHFPDTGMDEAKKRENDPARSMKIAVANAYSHCGTEAQQPWFEKTMNTLYGVTQREFCYVYTAFLVRKCSPAATEKAIPAVHALYTDNHSPTAIQGAQTIIFSLDYVYAKRLDNLQKKINSTKKKSPAYAKMLADKADMQHLLGVLDEEKKKMTADK
ncbi:MAG TPA: M1 family metallopeptidase [Bacteroidia bacterium]|nr:M1 family metallopeptidase [Bacteroidia bacterium]